MRENFDLFALLETLARHGVDFIVVGGVKLLLDTHALLWFIRGDERLGLRARGLIEHPDHHRFVSVASAGVSLATRTHVDV